MPDVVGIVLQLAAVDQFPDAAPPVHVAVPIGVAYDALMPQKKDMTPDMATAKRARWIDREERCIDLITKGQSRDFDMLSIRRMPQTGRSVRQFRKVKIGDL